MKALLVLRYAVNQVKKPVFVNLSNNCISNGTCCRSFLSKIMVQKSTIWAMGSHLFRSPTPLYLSTCLPQLNNDTSRKMSPL